MSEEIVKVIDLVPGITEELTTVQASSLDEGIFWTEFVCKHTPVIIKGGAKNWRAVEYWKNQEYLSSLCVNTKVNMYRTFNAVPSDLHFPSPDHGHLSKHINEIYNSSKNATYSLPAIQIPISWAEDLGVFSFLGKKFDKKPRAYSRDRLFIYRNASTEWHYHPIDETLTSQLVGSKKISLFRLTQENWNHYSKPIKANIHHISSGKQFFPQDGNLKKYEGVLEAGDTVYVPPFWWHGIDPADQDLGITHAHCFRSPLKRIGDWSDPITQETIKFVMDSRKLFIPLALGLIACSSLGRKLSKEKWWPV